MYIYTVNQSRRDGSEQGSGRYTPTCAVLCEVVNNYVNNFFLKKFTKVFYCQELLLYLQHQINNKHHDNLTNQSRNR